MVTTVVMKHHDQKQLGEERVCFTLWFSRTWLKEVRAGTWMQELKQTGQRSALTALLP